jgi:hypothetical protein
MCETVKNNTGEGGKRESERKVEALNENKKDKRKKKMMKISMLC